MENNNISILEGLTSSRMLIQQFHYFMNIVPLTPEQEKSYVSDLWYYGTKMKKVRTKLLGLRNTLYSDPHLDYNIQALELLNTRIKTMIKDMSKFNRTDYTSPTS